MQQSEIISRLDLQPHPEGGFYRETYRSKISIPEVALSDEYKGPRNYSTAIYFLLTQGNFSAFHRVVQDEMWHFYLGSPIELFEISPEGEVRRTIVGKDIAAGQLPQYLVPGGNWFASRVLAGSGEYSLAGCTVAPGFDFRDFEMAERMELIRDFPDHRELILELTRE